MGDRLAVVRHGQAQAFLKSRWLVGARPQIMDEGHGLAFRDDHAVFPVDRTAVFLG